jgi:hypothetical protein
MTSRKKPTSSNPKKMKAFDSFAEWKRDQSSQNQRLITALSKIVKETAPAFTTSVKWGQGCWIQGDTPKIYIHTEPDHVQFGFYAGSSLKDPENLLVGGGKYVRHVKVFTAKDIDRDALIALIEQVA